MGFATLASAKRSLSRYCEINKDYIVNTDVNYSGPKQAKKGTPEWSQEFLIMKKGRCTPAAACHKTTVLPAGIIPRALYSVVA